VDTDGDARDHVLRPFGDAAVDFEEVRAFEGFEAKADLVLASKIEVLGERLTSCS
jgi:hypothetical protein